MDQKKQIDLQTNIINNSKSLHDYYKDFNSWEKEINEKDKILAKTDFKPKKSDFLLERENPEDLKGIPNFAEKKNKKKKEKDTTLKRDGNPIKDYYDKWDRFDPVIY